MKLINWLKSLWGKPEPDSNGYAVIYDSLDKVTGDWKDDMYEVFDTPEEAVQFFNEAYGSVPEEVMNPRVVKILDPIPGDWAKEY